MELVLPVCVFFNLSQDINLCLLLYFSDAHTVKCLFCWSLVHYSARNIFYTTQHVFVKKEGSHASMASTSIKLRSWLGIISRFSDQQMYSYTSRLFCIHVWVYISSWNPYSFPVYLNNSAADHCISIEVVYADRLREIVFTPTQIKAEAPAVHIFFGSTWGYICRILWAINLWELYIQSQQPTRRRNAIE